MEVLGCFFTGAELLRSLLRRGQLFAQCHKYSGPDVLMSIYKNFHCSEVRAGKGPGLRCWRITTGEEEDADLLKPFRNVGNCLMPCQTVAPSIVQYCLQFSIVCSDW